MKARIIEEGLLIPREVVDRVLPGTEEVEIFEEPGRLLIAPAAGRGEGPDGAEEDPILNLGRNPVRTGTRDDPILALGEDPVDDPGGPTDASANHDRYLYG